MLILPNLDLKQGISYLEKEGGLREIEGRDRQTEIYNDRVTKPQRNKETERQRGRADNNNPEKSWVAQFVKNNVQ